MTLIADSDISSVPPEFVKYFFIMLGFVASAAVAAFLAYRKGQRASGAKDDPVNIAQPLEVSKKVEYAPKEEVHEIRQHIARLMEAGDDRRIEIIEAVHGSERRMIKEVKDVHERLNPVAESCKGHDGILKQIEARMKTMEDGAQRLHQRVDDAIRTAASRKS